MWKGIAGAAAGVAIAASALVVAQAQTEPTARDGERWRTERRERWQPSAEDRNAFNEARLAALKAGLALNPEQEKNWPAFEQAAREAIKLRAERREAMRNWQPTGDPAERLRRRADAMSETGAATKKLADAVDPLYKSLDESQKRRFAMMSRLGRLLAMDDPRFEFGRRDRDDMRMQHWGPRRDGERMRERDGRDDRDGRSMRERDRSDNRDGSDIDD